MSQTPVSFPIHGNAAAEYWANESLKWYKLSTVALIAAALMMFVFSVAMAVALDHAHNAANRAAQSAKDALHSAEAAWWEKHNGQTYQTWPVPSWVVPTWSNTKIMQCDAEKCEVR